MGLLSFSWPSSLLLSPLLLLFSVTIVAANIAPGSTLFSNQNQSWTSPNNTFSLRFIIATTTPPSYSAAVTYDGIPIWQAGGAAATVDSSGSFQFLNNGNLRLVNGSGSVIWQSNTANRGISTAALDDTGNFVLKNDTTSIWSTFENPTDTIVPSQNFTSNNTLRSGDYSFSLLRSGNITLKWNDSITYWNLGLNSSVDSNLTNPSLGLQPIGILSIFDSTLSSSAVMAYSSDYAEGSDILRYLKLDSDGNLRIYSAARGSGNPTERWSAVTDQCQIFGFCGNMGICGYNDTSPVCSCPSENFLPIDSMDTRKGCKRKTEIENCPGSATMLELDNTQFLTYPPETASQVFFVGISACRLNCLVSGSCAASTSLSDGTGLCYLKVPSFVSGYQSPALPSTSYIKVCGPVDPNPSPSSPIMRTSKSLEFRAWVIVVVIVGTLLVLVLLEGGLWWFCCKNSRRFGGLSAQYALLEYASGAPVQFSYKELQRSTKGFKEKLGEGGFGAVYRGILANRTVVAVKQLEGIEQGEKQFRMEVATISSTHHLNLVRLVGFCSEGRHRLLVYEFMKNGSLDSFLFTNEEEHSGRFLNWGSRFSIALGTARGITYLHEECRDCIVHCDIKPENILLDENFHAKVSDFGLAKLINPKDHRYRTLTSVRGTRGYLAPEWLANLPITSKSDVYSFGMVLLEIVSGKRNFEVSHGKKFSIWAYEEFESGNVGEILDKRFDERELNMEEVVRVLKVSFWCIQEQPSQRPSMGKVVQMLEGISGILKPPPPKMAVAMGEGSGSSVNVSGFSTLAAPTLSTDSSFQTVGVSSSASRGNSERATSSIVQRSSNS